MPAWGEVSGIPGRQVCDTKTQTDDRHLTEPCWTLRQPVDLLSRDDGRPLTPEAE